ncbi:uncharacterized protein LOC129748288 [Uranotaenia lowii]|uniref:uncharacterized protein LOC129748288 n=1 Tax=Uranotaenia lowii TaxID=190385 RepID=UPI002478738E|nr:uncharacterized protein LOC129748288 [Uranotaenia lowii]
MRAKSANPLVVRYRDATYDLTEFAHKHPGGLNTLNGLHEKDMQERFEKAPGHSAAARYLMNEYKICDKNNNSDSTIYKDDSSNSSKLSAPSKDNHMNGAPKNGLLNGSRKLNGFTTTTTTGGIPTSTDESMEHLVDWTKPMLSQIPTLGKHYSEWVNKPVDRELRLFGPPWLENLTKTPWWLVPGFWIPTIFFLIHLGVREQLSRSPDDPVSIRDHLSLTVFVSLAIGVLVWTLLEYTLHRWVFHLDPKDNKFLHTFHFLLHGLHHKVPFDPYRLVFPPVPAVLLATFFYQPVRLLLPHPLLMLSGGLIGYLTYDMIHYYIHYGSPNGGHLYHMKRYHYQHHFVHHEQGFGISSTLWDDIFGTTIVLRKLKYLLKW